MSPNLLWLRAIKTALCLLQSSCCSWDTLPLSLGLSLGYVSILLIKGEPKAQR